MLEVRSGRLLRKLPNFAIRKQMNNKIKFSEKVSIALNGNLLGDFMLPYLGAAYEFSDAIVYLI